MRYNKGFFILLLCIMIMSGMNQPSAFYNTNVLDVKPGYYVKASINSSWPRDDGRYIITMETVRTVESILSFDNITNKLILVNSTYFNRKENISKLAENAVIQYWDLVWAHNRSVAIPLVYYSLLNASNHLVGTLLEYDSLDEMKNIDNTVFYLENGDSFLWNEHQNYSSLPEYMKWGYWAFEDSWNRHKYFPERTSYVISPYSQVDGIIDYGWYKGRIVGVSELEIGNKLYAVLHCHINYTESEMIWTDENSAWGIAISDTERYYEKQTGLLLKSFASNKNFNFTSSYEPYEVKLTVEEEKKSEESGTFTLYLGPLMIIPSLLIMSIILLNKKRKHTG